MGKKIIIGLVVGVLLVVVGLFITGRVIKGIYTSEEFRTEAEGAMAAMIGGGSKVKIGYVTMTENFGVEFANLAVTNRGWGKPLNVSKLTFIPESPISVLWSKRGRINIAIQSPHGNGLGHFITEGLDQNARIESMIFKTEPIALEFFGQLAGEGSPVGRFAKIFRGRVGMDGEFAGGDLSSRMPPRGTVNIATSEITLLRRLPRGMTPTFKPASGKLSVDGDVVKFSEPLKLESPQMDVEFGGFLSPPRARMDYSPLTIKINGSAMVQYLAGSMFSCQGQTPTPAQVLNPVKSEKTYRLYQTSRRVVCK